MILDDHRIGEQVQAAPRWLPDVLGEEPQEARVDELRHRAEPGGAHRRRREVPLGGLERARLSQGVEPCSCSIQPVRVRAL